jgi:hypothetical protein
LREFDKIYAEMEEINENKNYLRDFEILSQSWKLIKNCIKKIKEKLKTSKGIRLIFIPEWEEFSDKQKDLFLDIVLSPSFISKIEDAGVKNKIISCLENLPQIYGGEKRHGEETSLSEAIDTIAVNLSQYLKRNIEKDRIKKLRENIKNLPLRLREIPREVIRSNLESTLLRCMNFWDFNNFQNFEEEIKKFRKENRINIKQFKEEREKIWKIFSKDIYEEYIKNTKHKLEFATRELILENQLLNNEIEGEIYSEKRKKLIDRYCHWYLEIMEDESSLEIDRNILTQRELTIHKLMEEMFKALKSYYENQIKNLLWEKEQEDKISAETFLKNYGKAKYLTIDDLIQIAKERLRIDINTNFVYLDENDTKIRYENEITSFTPIEDLFYLALIKKENDLYSFEKLKEKIKAHPKLSKIPELFHYVLKDFIFYEHFRRKDWLLMNVYASKNTNKYLKSIESIFANHEFYRKTPNEFFRKVIAFYIKKEILFKKIRSTSEYKTDSILLQYALEEELFEDLEKLHEYLKKQKDKKTKRYWNLINSILTKLGYLPIKSKECLDFEKSMQVF